MRWSEIDKYPCSVARTLSVVGESWTLLIIRSCFLSCRRFDEFQSTLGVTRHLLADRLKKLVDHEILDKEVYQNNPVRYEYRLTEKGRDLYETIVSLTKWGDKWMSGTEGPPLTLIHTKCNHATQPLLVCNVCQQPLHARNTVAKFDDQGSNSKKEI